MRNNTKSEIVITMNNINNASRLFDFLKKALCVSDMGGDLYLTYEGAEKATHFIGHDIRKKDIKHVIHIG